MKLIKVLTFSFLIAITVLITGCNEKQITIDTTAKPTSTIEPTNRPRNDAPYHGKLKKNKPVWFNLYDEEKTEKIEPLILGVTDTASVQFYATTSIEGVQVLCPSSANDIGTIEIRLFKWDISYEKTVAGPVLRKKSIVNYRDNQWVEFEFDEMEEGEYLLDLLGTNEITGAWTSNVGFFGARTFYNGTEQKASMMAKIKYVHTPEVYVAELSENFTNISDKEVPKEIVPGENHPIVKMNIRPDTWAAVDGLNRTLPSYKSAGDKKKRYAGIVYSIKHSTNVRLNPVVISNRINKYPDAVNVYRHRAWSGNNLYYWEEPVYGFYTGTDKYVYRKHAELLADSGIDVVALDISGGNSTWKSQYEALCSAWIEARQHGINTPKIAFLLNPDNPEDAKIQLKTLYTDLYRINKYNELWFYWNSKPLILSNSDFLNKDIKIEKDIINFFSFKKINSSYYSEPREYNVWGKISVYPQTKYGVDKNGDAQQMTVSTAQNVNIDGVTAMNGKGVYGRSYTRNNFFYTYTYMGYEVKIDQNSYNSVLYGLNFQQQWDYAMYVDPQFILINGWNENTTDRIEEWGGVKNAFRYQYNDEYSTDIEPSKGILKDHYYYQLVANVRKFKGVSKPDKIYAYKTIDINKGIDQWDNVLPEYNHYKGNTPNRDEVGLDRIKYVNQTVRNDIVSAKVAYDRLFIYFLVKTDKDLTACTDNAWMRLFIDTGEKEESWEGFEYVINRTNPDETCYIEKSTGGWNWKKCGEAKYKVTGNYLQIAVPRIMLGMKIRWITEVPSFNFKWSDNMQEDGNIMDFYLNGDVAPGGRFCFRFNTD